MCLKGAVQSIATTQATQSFSSVWISIGAFWAAWVVEKSPEFNKGFDSHVSELSCSIASEIGAPAPGWCINYAILGGAHGESNLARMNGTGATGSELINIRKHLPMRWLPEAWHYLIIFLSKYILPRSVSVISSSPSSSLTSFSRSVWIKYRIYFFPQSNKVIISVTLILQ